MTKKEKIDFLLENLESLYPSPVASLNYKDAFTFLVSVALSAQTTDKKVNEVTSNLFKVARTPEKMARLSEKEIKDLIKQIGLSATKSKNLKKMSQMLVDQFDSKVPNTFEALESLPGVGHKTASVVMAEIFDVPAFPVDTHIHRQMWRWGLSNGKSVEQTEKDAKRLFPKEKWNKLHLQIIFYGREYSPARNLDLEKDFITRKIGRKSFLNGRI